MTEVAQNLQEIQKNLPSHVTLIAVSKRQPIQKVIDAYKAGHRDFGENKVQELVGKVEEFDDDTRWHFIGHLQTNKVKYIAPFVHMIHSVDSLKLLKEINKRAQQNERTIDVLLQMRIAKEEAKTGLDAPSLDQAIQELAQGSFPNIEFRGLMGMATQTDNQEQIRSEFQSVKEKLESLKDTFPKADILSMGMSGDMEIAMEEGSNMVRVGTAVFGARDY